MPDALLPPPPPRCAHRALGSAGLQPALAGIVPDSLSLKAEEVLRIANKAAAAYGYILSEFRPPNVRYKLLSDGKKSWVITYDGEPDRNGNSLIGKDFLIFIDDSTKEVEVFPGA